MNDTPGGGATITPEPSAPSPEFREAVRLAWNAAVDAGHDAEPAAIHCYVEADGGDEDRAVLTTLTERMAALCAPAAEIVTDADQLQRLDLAGAGLRSHTGDLMEVGQAGELFLTNGGEADPRIALPARVIDKPNPWGA